MYITKYNLKYALECTDESVITEAEKKQLRQIEYVSKNISRAFWIYAPMDAVLTGVWFRRSGRGHRDLDFIQSSLAREKLRGKTLFIAAFLTFRIFGMYHLSSGLSKRYLADNVERILRKSNPRKDQVLEKMKDL